MKGHCNKHYDILKDELDRRMKEEIELRLALEDFTKEHFELLAIDIKKVRREKADYMVRVDKILDNTQ